MTCSIGIYLPTLYSSTKVILWKSRLRSVRVKFRLFRRKCIYACIMRIIAYITPKAYIYNNDSAVYYTIHITCVDDECPELRSRTSSSSSSPSFQSCAFVYTYMDHAEDNAGGPNVLTDIVS